MRIAGTGWLKIGVCSVMLGACSAPDKFILPGQVDLKLAAGDRIKLCTDDGFDDTTPMSDCVIIERASHPLSPYADALKAKGWAKIEGDDSGREVWALGKGAACKQLSVDAGAEKMSRKRFMIVRFEVSACAI